MVCNQTNVPENLGDAVCAPHYPLKLATIVKQQLMTTCQTHSLQPSWKQSTHLWQELPEIFLLKSNKGICAENWQIAQ